EMVPQSGHAAGRGDSASDRQMARDVRGLAVADPAAPALERPRAPTAPKHAWLDLSTIVWLAAGIGLLLLVLVPLFWIVLASVRADGTGQLTLSNYVQLATTPLYWQPVWNSLVLASAVAVVAVVAGTALAWAVSRTDMPGRAFIRTCVFGGFVTPAF